MHKLRNRHTAEKVWIKDGKRLARATISLLDLPDECILMILDNLNLQAHELCQIMKVCKQFYELSFNPRLWRNANFHFISYLYPPRKRTCFDKELKRRELFANFLMKRNAVLSDLCFRFCDIFNEIELAKSLVEKCCTKELKKVEMQFLCRPMYVNYELPNTIDLLKKLSEQSPRVCFFTFAPVDGACSTARSICTMAHIQHLDITFYEPLEEEEEGTNPIEIILSNLKKLTKFKLRVDQMDSDAERRGCALKSDSLEDLDYTLSKGFNIKFLDLPRLHSYTATFTDQSFQGKTTPCLVQLIQKGCPKLRSLNSTQTSCIFEVPGMSVGEVEKFFLRLCSCNSCRG